MSRRPSNGPTFSKATYKAKPGGASAPSPERKQAELDQSARDCADTKLFRTHPAAWVAKHILKKS